MTRSWSGARVQFRSRWYLDGVPKLKPLSTVFDQRVRQTALHSLLKRLWTSQQSL